MPTFPDLPTPAPASRSRIDYGPTYEDGLITRVLPELLPGSYRVLVPQVDSDGNEIGGLRVPEIAVPRGTATGWSIRAAEAGVPGELCGLDGMFWPFARTKTERERGGDPRSLEERYASQAEYLAKIRAAALVLKEAGYVLAEDVPRLVGAAAMRVR